MRLVVGLGNPGPRYTHTRHNIGALVVARASERWAIPLTRAEAAWWGKGNLDSQDVVLAAPVAWMNRSGPVVNALLMHHVASPADVIVVHDDLDLPLGRLRIKRTGGAGGHNGVLSIVSALETRHFWRLKIGIGRPAPHENPAEYVLCPFSQDELSSLDQILDRAAEALACFVVEGSESAMNRYNVRTETSAED